MRVVEPPNHIHLEPNDVNVFLAGGITGCPDWQSLFLQECNGHLESNVVFSNPRRENFDTSNPAMTLEQIQWEFDYLNRANIVLFWFPQESVCPIALFELGKFWQKQNTPNYFSFDLPDQGNVIVGCDLNYPRRIDIVEQGRLLNQTVSIGFEEFSKRAMAEIHKRQLRNLK
jgi:hypothetical protein